VVAPDLRDERHGDLPGDEGGAAAPAALAGLRHLPFLGLEYRRAVARYRVYTSTKEALNRMVETWRAEHPEIGFTRIFVGPTDEAGTGTEMHESAINHMVRWPGLGIHSGALGRPETIAEAVMLVLCSPDRVNDLAVQPRDSPLPWGV